MARKSAGKADKQDGSRMVSAVAAIPVVGDLAKSAEAQARWMQDLVEQNARLMAQLPATLKTFNDTLERFSQTASRLDQAVTSIEVASRTLTVPLERLAASLDPKTLRELPETLDALRKEAIPALRAAADTQRQVTVLQGSLERALSVVADLPGANLLRRRAARDDVTEPPTA